MPSRSTALTQESEGLTLRHGEEGREMQSSAFLSVPPCEPFSLPLSLVLKKYIEYIQTCPR